MEAITCLVDTILASMEQSRTDVEMAGYSGALCPLDHHYYLPSQSVVDAEAPERFGSLNRAAKSKFATSLPFLGCCARGTAKRLREMALIGETCLDRDKRNRFLAMQEKFLCAFNPGVKGPLIRRHAGRDFKRSSEL